MDKFYTEFNITIFKDLFISSRTSEQKTFADNVVEFFEKIKKDNSKNKFKNNLFYKSFQFVNFNEKEESKLNETSEFITLNELTEIISKFLGGKSIEDQCTKMMN